MSDQAMIFILVCVILLLLVVIGYQQFAFGKGMRDQLNKISEKLSDILEKDSDEKVMVFTDHKVLMDLSGQINANRRYHKRKCWQISRTISRRR